MGAPRVFISSTRRDLTDNGFRKAVYDGINDVGFAAIGMEHFAAGGSRHTLGECLKKVDEADVLIVVVAHCYGSEPPGKDKSYTWLECEHARNVRKIQVIPFFLRDENETWPYRLREAYRYQSEPKRKVDRAIARLGAFKKWLDDGPGFRGEFDTAEELQRGVASALRKWSDENPTAAPARESTSAYLEWLERDTSHVGMDGIVIDGQKREFDIERLYIPLCQKGEGDVPLQRALSDPGAKLVVEGDPGAGKTTFIRRLAHAACKRDLAFLGLSEAPFPILISAAELFAHMRDAKDRPNARLSADWIPRLLGRLGEGRPWDLSVDFFRKKLNEGGCLLMVDGLDEAPDEEARKDVAKVLDDAARSYSKCRIVATTRPVPHYCGARFQTARVGDLRPEDRRSFLREWAAMLRSVSPAKAERFEERLEEAVRDRMEVRRLAKNPVMLTCLAVLQANGQTLPDARVELYKAILDWLAGARKQKEGRVPAKTCLEYLQKLALGMLEKGMRRETDRKTAEEILTAPMGGLKAARRFLDLEEVDSGIVKSQGSAVRFWHLTFLEYLAAMEIYSLPDEEQYARAVASGSLHRPEWRQTMLFLAGAHRHFRGAPSARALIDKILDRAGEDQTLAEQARCAGLLGVMLREDLRGFEIKDDRYGKMRKEVERIFDPKESASIDIKTRIEAAEALGQGGDFRFAGDTSGNWVRIPAGEFSMGSNDKPPEWAGKEAPVHKVYLDAFEISRYPVTVQEYGLFLQETEHKPPNDWDQQQDHGNRPVTGVSWDDAVAYCTWASRHFNRTYRLPTEAEWERAARGTRKGEPYPWGTGEPSPDDANFNQNVGAPTPVGLYPKGVTDEGLFDMAGNVWEWCSDWSEEYKPGRAENPKGPKNGTGRSVRGGSWYDLSQLLRVSCRLRFLPVYQNVYLGFRCVRE